MDLTTIKIPTKEGIQFLSEYRSRYPATGLYPFLIGDEDELKLRSELAQFNESDAANILRASTGITIERWIEGQRNWIESRRLEFEEDDFSREEILGHWPEDNRERISVGLRSSLLERNSFESDLKREVFLGLVRIEQPWQLPAILRYGNWNSCPKPEVHCAFHREWQERFGAEITSMSFDIVECTVRNPPTDRTTAIALAWEQYWYCGDIVSQGCDTISNLAASLLNADSWFFWWD